MATVIWSSASAPRAISPASSISYAKGSDIGAQPWSDTRSINLCDAISTIPNNSTKCDMKCTKPGRNRVGTGKVLQVRVSDNLAAEFATVCLLLDIDQSSAKRYVFDAFVENASNTDGFLEYARQDIHKWRTDDGWRSNQNG